MQNFVHHRDERTWKNATSWIPERWFEANAKDKASLLSSFGTGPRNCIGMNLANIELCLVVSKRLPSVILCG